MRIGERRAGMREEEGKIWKIKLERGRKCCLSLITGRTRRRCDERGRTKTAFTMISDLLIKYYSADHRENPVRSCTDWSWIDLPGHWFGLLKLMIGHEIKKNNRNKRVLFQDVSRSSSRSTRNHLVASRLLATSTAGRGNPSGFGSFQQLVEKSDG